MKAALQTSLLLLLLVSFAQVHADEPVPMDGNQPEKAAPLDMVKKKLERPLEKLVSPNSIPPLLAPAADVLEAAKAAAPEFRPKVNIEAPTKLFIEKTAPLANGPIANNLPDRGAPLLLQKNLQLPRLDVGKGLIERRVEGLFLPPGANGFVVSAPDADVIPLQGEDLEKDRIERPVKALVADDRKADIEAPVKKVVADVPKSEIEIPVENLIREQPDVTKRLIIEMPVTEFVLESAETEKEVESNALLHEEIASDEKPIDDNPKVEPGKVEWHADFDEAKAAAEKSGKPVLLFQLMGQLDQRFT